jgi:uncharacterized protein
MEVEQKDNGIKGAFYIALEGVIVAEMTYVWVGKEKIIIDHTEVDEILKGKGAGKQMINKAVAFARDNSLKIIPLCPFAKSVFDKEIAFRDVI